MTRKATYVLWVLVMIAGRVGAIDVGDRIDTFYTKSKANLSAVSKLSASGWWPEDGVVVRRPSQGTVDGAFAVLTTQEDLPFAVGVKTAAGNTFLFDIDGDGVIDFSNSDLIVPFWIITRYTVGKATDNQLIKIFDRLMKSFQSDQGPVLENAVYKDALSTLQRLAQDPSRDDRDLAYAFTFFSKYRDKSPSIAIAALNWLSDRYIKRFGPVHRLLVLYSAETSLLLDKPDTARSLVVLLLQMDPTFIPALVLDYRTELHPTLKKHKLDALMKAYPTHWLVKAYAPYS